MIIGGNVAITKTKFINYVRCPRYVALDDLKKEKLDSFITFEEYKKEEENDKLNDLLEKMYDETGEDLIDVKNEHLEMMLPYYNEVEILAGKVCNKYFQGKFKFSRSTDKQESFDFKKNGIRYLCYVDIYNEDKDAFNIIEVKATTTKKFLDLGATINKEKKSIFAKGKDGIYYLIEDLNINVDEYMGDKYYTQKKKLYDKYAKEGHYVYDLAVQRYIIENDLKQNGEENKIGKIKYYLAVLNSEYVFDGKYENEKPIYNTDQNGNEIVSFIDFTSVTKDMMNQIELDRKKVETYISELNGNECPLGVYCEYKNTTKCKYTKVCWDKVPKENSIFNFFESHFGFVDEDGVKRERYDLINDGYLSMLDMPRKWITKEKHLMQKHALETKEPYFNKNKIIDGLKQLKYPIYHLDFETFPCPLPRYKGEKCYTQSVFQFSLHIERKEGICDKEKDHIEYLAVDHQDRREELIKKMCDSIGEEGTVLVYNESFEKTRLKELANIFPEYKDKLLKIRDMVFDLMDIVKTKTKLYETLGYSKEESKEFNYYDYRMSGSFSIKKVLPLFSNLTYKDMEIGNGVEAMIAYATFPKLNEKEYNYKYQKLVEYCQQDTWAMYLVLEGLRNCVK